MRGPRKPLNKCARIIVIPAPAAGPRPGGEGANLPGEWNSGREGNLFVKEKIRRLQKPVRRNEQYKKRVYTILWREGSNKIEKSETESSVSMQGTRLYRQSFEERLQSDTRTGWMTGCCTAKNNRTTWVRGFRGTSWKTSGRKTKYSRINRVKKNSWQFAFK